MARLRLLCSQGDRVVEWDIDRAEAGERDARGAVREAERIFEEARRNGATAFRVEPGHPAERIDRFDPHVEELVVVPRVAGGAITPGDHTVMTRVGMTRLEEELERLRTVERAEVATRLKEARESPGDQSDNLELLEAQQDLAMLESRIAELERSLAQAKVVEDYHGESAAIGATIVVRDDEGEEETYTLVGPAEADPRNARISIASPVGQALLGGRAGDEAVVETPAGPRRIKIIKVE